jgi:hypothetical protein
MKNYLLKGFLVSLIPVVFFTVAILITSKSDTPQVKFVPEVVRPGYQTEPPKYIVEASYAKYWHDSRIPVLIVFAYIIVIAGTMYVVEYVNKKEIKNGNFFLAIVWVVSGLLIFVPMAFKYGTSSYQSTLTVDEYQYSKNNLDALFPSIESSPK